MGRCDEGLQGEGEGRRQVTNVRITISLRAIRAWYFVSRPLNLTDKLMKKVLAGFVFGLVVACLLALVMDRRARIELGIDADELGKRLGVEVVLDGTLLVYPPPPGEPTEVQRERDVKYYFIRKVDGENEVSYGFNAKRKLIRVVEVRTYGMYAEGSGVEAGKP